MRERTARLVKQFREGLTTIAEEVEQPPTQVLQAAHVALAKQSRGRKRSLYHAAIVVARQENTAAPWADVLKRASEINQRLQRVQERGDWDDEQLRECQEIQANLQQRADVASVPKSHSKTQRAVQQEVTRTTDEVASKLTALNAAYGTEHVFALTRGNHESSLSTQLVTSNKADDFFSFRLDKQIEDVFADMEGYAVWGAEAGKNGKGKTIDFRGQISRTFGQQLVALTGNDKIRIQWKNLDAFCKKYGLELVGWPSTIPFKKMANINRSDAKLIWALVKENTCRFQRKGTGTPRTRMAHSNEGDIGAQNAQMSPTTPAPSADPTPGPSTFPIPVYSSPEPRVPYPAPHSLHDLQHELFNSQSFSHNSSDAFDASDAFDVRYTV